MIKLECPECGNTGWKMLEGATVLRSVEFDIEDDALIIDADPFSEFEIDSQTTVVLGYTCANDICPFIVKPNEMLEFANKQADKYIPETSDKRTAYPWNR